MFGTLDDHPLILLELGRLFAEEIRPNCYSCHIDAASWAEDNLEKERGRLVKEICYIEDNLDDIQDWLKEYDESTFAEYIEMEVQHT